MIPRKQCRSYLLFPPNIFKFLESLSPAGAEKGSRKMELYAGNGDNLDYEIIGR